MVNILVGFTVIENNYEMEFSSAVRAENLTGFFGSIFQTLALKGDNVDHDNFQIHYTTCLVKRLIIKPTTKLDGPISPFRNINNPINNQSKRFSPSK